MEATHDWLRAGKSPDLFRRNRGRRKAKGNGPAEAFFDLDALTRPLADFGNLGRNILRGPNQKRFDLSPSKTTKIVENVNLESRWEVFNFFNNVNFATPNNDLQDRLDIGTISNTVGPRVMQLGAKIRV